MSWDTYTLTHVLIHSHTRIHTRTLTRAHTRTYTHTDITRTHTDTDVLTHTHTRTHTHTQTYSHTQTLTHVLTHSHAYSHTHARKVPLFTVVIVRGDYGRTLLKRRLENTYRAFPHPRGALSTSGKKTLCKRKGICRHCRNTMGDEINTLLIKCFKSPF